MISSQALVWRCGQDRCLSMISPLYTTLNWYIIKITGMLCWVLFVILTKFIILGLLSLPRHINLSKLQFVRNCPQTEFIITSWSLSYEHNTHVPVPFCWWPLLSSEVYIYKVQGVQVAYGPTKPYMLACVCVVCGVCMGMGMSVGMGIGIGIGMVYL